jgi:hypothetical protein
MDGACSEWAIYKWYRSGIPEEYWHALRTLDQSLTLEELHLSNELLRRPRNRARRSKPETACAA